MNATSVPMLILPWIIIQPPNRNTPAVAAVRIVPGRAPERNEVIWSRNRVSTNALLRSRNFSASGSPAFDVTYVSANRNPHALAVAIATLGLLGFQVALIP